VGGGVGVGVGVGVEVDLHEKQIRKIISKKIVLKNIQFFKIYSLIIVIGI
jgi:hypothetical protein